MAGFFAQHGPRTLAIPLHLLAPLKYTGHFNRSSMFRPLLVS